MAEYINRERARFEAKRYFKNMDEIQEDLDMLFCMLPAENVAPVRHGRWIKENSRKKSYLWICSNCRKIAYFCSGDGKCAYQYCPNCGADMSKEDEDE